MGRRGWDGKCDKDKEVLVSLVKGRVCESWKCLNFFLHLFGHCSTSPCKLDYQGSWLSFSLYPKTASYLRNPPPGKKTVEIKIYVIADTN